MTIELAWVDRELRSLDRLAGELVVASMFAEERPPRGIAGLLDWRLGGRLSRLCAEGYVEGSDGETLLVPGRPRVGFEKIVVIGLGARAAFDDAAFERTLSRTLGVLAGLQARKVTIELPGRHAGAIDADRALTILVTLLGLSGGEPLATELEAITLVDDADAHRAYSAARGRLVRARR